MSENARAAARQHLERAVQAGASQHDFGSMIWRWFRLWRERRDALKELQDISRTEEEALAAQPDNPLITALNAMRAGDLAEAAKQWDIARQRLPNVIYRSTESVEILMELQRWDEAEEVAREAMRLAPGRALYRMAYANIAGRRGDYEECLRRWQRVRLGPELTEPAVRMGHCHMMLGRPEKAEAIFEKAVRRAPEDPVVRIEFARIAETRGDWAQALIRWRLVSELFKLPVGIEGQARALMELGQLDAADAMLSAVFVDHSRNLGIAVVAAQVAERRGDVDTARKRWDHVRGIDPAHAPPV